MTNSSQAPDLNWRDSFQVKSFRYQWPADLATSWAFEMETILLGWYILSTSGSVLMLVVYGSLQYLGSLLSPVFGVVCDRMGYRRMLWSTRAIYALLAFGIMLLSYFEALTPERVLILAAIVGIIRPSDQMMRNALIARTLPAAQLMGALGISRMTSESARIAGALAGAGIVAVLGMTSAYAVVTLLYVISFWLSRGVDDVQPSPNATALASPLQDLKSAFTYVWHKPILMGAMAVAFLVNLLAFPFALGLLPYAAKNIFLTNQTGLGFLGASFAFGGLLASLTLSSHKFKLRASQTMIIASVAWFALDLVFCIHKQFVHGYARFDVGRFCAKPVHDTFGSSHAACHRPCVSRAGDGHAHAGHLGLAHWAIGQRPLG